MKKDLHTGEVAPGRLLVKWAKLDTMLLRWQQNSETVATGPDGHNCRRDTSGLLTRRTVTSADPLVTLIGKEAGSVETDDDPAEDHASTHLTLCPRTEAKWQTMAAAVRRIGIAKIARATGLTERGLRKSLKPDTTPHDHTEEAVRHATADAARQALELNWKDDLKVITAFVRTPRACRRCGTQLPDDTDARRKYCKDPMQETRHLSPCCYRAPKCRSSALG